MFLFRFSLYPKIVPIVTAVTGTRMHVQRKGFFTVDVFCVEGESLSIRFGGFTVPTVSTEVLGTLLGTSSWVEPVEELHQVN